MVSGHLGVGSLVLLAGCASMNNTLAQDLAEERIRTCSHIQGINITRVDKDGRVWASTWQTTDLLSMPGINACSKPVADHNGTLCRDPGRDQAAP